MAKGFLPPNFNNPNLPKFEKRLKKAIENKNKEQFYGSIIFGIRFLGNRFVKDYLSSLYAKKDSLSISLEGVDFAFNAILELLPLRLKMQFLAESYSYSPPVA